MAGGGGTTKPKPMGDVTREAEKEEMMGRGGRGYDDNTNNGCYRGMKLGR